MKTAAAWKHRSKEESLSAWTGNEVTLLDCEPEALVEPVLTDEPGNFTYNLWAFERG